MFASVFRPNLFEGQVVLVTGGGTGIGRCIAHELAALGATVVIAGRRESVLDATAAEIRDDGGRCETQPLDIRDEEVVDRALEAIVQRHGRLDGLVNNAGGQFPSPVADMKPKGWRTVVDLNLNGTFIVTQAAFRHGMQQHGGAVVSVIADVRRGSPGLAHMAAARAGVENFTRSIAQEWSHFGVRANCVAPGTILSSGLLEYPPEVQDRTAKGGQSFPAGRLGTESEISAAVVFLLSPAASFISGETLAVDGGSHLETGRLIRLKPHPGWRRFDGFHRRPDFSGTPFEGVGE